MSVKVRDRIKTFIEEYIKKYDTARDLIDNLQNDKHVEENYNKLTSVSKTSRKKFNNELKGFLYERLWDICIKFGLTDFTYKKSSRHTFRNINNHTQNISALFDDISVIFDKYLSSNYISGNSSGYSDISFETQYEKDEKTYKELHLVSCKYFEDETKKNIKDYEIQNLCVIIDNIKKSTQENNDICVYLFVKDKKTVISKFKKTHKSSDLLIKYISPNGNYENIYDENDLEVCYAKLKKLLDMYDYDTKKLKEKYIGIKQIKKVFVPRFHQELFIYKILDLMQKGEKDILIGAIPRSGKTFIFLGVILEYIKGLKDNSKKRFIIITSAPSETIPQYLKEVNDYIDFENYNIKAKEVVSKTDLSYSASDAHKHIIYIISKQRLCYDSGKSKKHDDDIEECDDVNSAKCNTKIEEGKLQKIQKNIDAYFGDNTFDIVFLDEAHYGMTTRLAQQMLESINLKSNCPKIFITATYNKPQSIYNIYPNAKLTWDITDINKIKHLSGKQSNTELTFLYDRFGKDLVDRIIEKNGGYFDKIRGPYINLPQPFLITTVWDKLYVKKENEKIDFTEIGFNMNKLFVPASKEKFVNEEHVTELLEYYFGYPDKNKLYKEQIMYRQRGILPRIERICNNKCRTLQSSNHKTSQIWFLPYGVGMRIKDIVNSLLTLLKNKFKNVYNKFMLYVALEKSDGYIEDEGHIFYMSSSKNIKAEIIDCEEKLVKSEYEGLIILAGNRLQLGISLPNVDIVSLFTNIENTDKIYQMIFRSMTEIDKDVECEDGYFCGKKKYGFMVDMNPQRTLFTLEYFTRELIDKTKTDRKYLLRTIADLVNLDKDMIMDKYDDSDKDYSKKYEKFTEEFLNKIYDIWEQTNDIKIIINKIQYDDEGMKEMEKGFDMKKLFEYETKKGSNKQIAGPDDAFQSGKNVKRTLADIFNPPDKKKKGSESISFKEYADHIILETIYLISIMTSYTSLDDKLKIDCVFHKTHDDNEEFKFQLMKILNELDEAKNSELKDMFLQGINDRLLTKQYKKDTDADLNQIFNLIRKLVSMIISEKEDMKGGKRNKKKTKNKNDREKQKGGNILSLDRLIYARKKKIYSIREPDKLLEFINENLKPKNIEKKENGEVFTPMTLVNEMLDKLPTEVWKNKELKWLDPAAGMGNFPVAVYMRLMEGLKTVITDEEERRKHILEDMLYMVELSKKNVFMMRKILCGKTASKKGYDLNIFEGSFIDTDKDVDIFMKTSKMPSNKIFVEKVKKILSLGGFDIIMGNPPYQYHKLNSKNSKAIWHLFVLNSTYLINMNGYLVYITPSGWRDILGNYREVFDYIKIHNLIYLSMNDYKTGSNIFGVGTNFDYYIVQHKQRNDNLTIVKDIDGNISEINLNKYEFIPSGKFQLINKLLAKNKKSVEILYDRNMYGTDKKNTSKTKNDDFKYPCCYSITQKDGLKLYYSNEKKGHFGIPKVIWSNGAGTYPIIDDKGNFGLTEFCYAIIDEKENLFKIKNAMNDPKFIDLMKYLKFKKDNKYNYKIIALFKKDFYMSFIGDKSVKSKS